MPADMKKQDLRSLLSGKSTGELEKLLALNPAEDNEAVDAAYIATILEVIDERERNEKEKSKRTLDAWKQFGEYRTEMKSQEEAEADRIEDPNRDHQLKTEHCQKSRKHTPVWRVGLIAAVIVVLLCGTAFGWNLFRAIADWTEDVFIFLTGQERTEDQNLDAYDILRNNVALRTDVLCVPHWAPEGTQESGTLSVTSRDDRCSIGMGYIADNRVFSVRLIVYTATLDSQLNTYQKDATICEEYVTNGIPHYIVGNNENLSAMWINEMVEGHIQGNLTVEELKLMIDSIYEE